ncbi:MAG: hypothetical protein ACXIUD_05990 [Mongoliitalea sp.]
MLSFFFLFASFIVMRLSAYFFLKSSGSLSIYKINYVSFIFWVDLILYSYIGSIIILVFNEIQFNTVIDSVTGGFGTRLIVWLSISYTMIAFPLGMMISNFIFKFNSKEIEAYNSKEIKTYISTKDSFIRLPLYFLTLISFFVVVHVFFSIGFIPILKTFQLKNEIEVLQLRASIDSNFPGNVYLKNIVGLNLLPILSYIAFGYYLKTKGFRDLIWYIFLLIITCLMLTYNVAKSPLVLYGIGYVFFIVYIKGSIPVRSMIKLGSILLLALTTFFLVAGKKNSISDLFFSYNDGITGRVLISQVSSLYKHFELFPDVYPHIGLGSISNQLSLGEQSKRSARLVLETVNPSWVENDMGGVFNTLFIGESFANFGVFGIIFMPLYIGFVIKSFHTLLIRLPKTPHFLSLLVFFSYKSNLTGGVNEYLYNPLVISVLLVFLILSLFSKFLKKITPDSLKFKPI